MHNWTRILKEVIPSPCYERPFVCDGFPCTCEVIVIGDNPATRLTTDWWSFWSDTSGFDYNHFLEVYQTERDRAGKGQVSNTRRRWTEFGPKALIVSKRILLEMRDRTAPDITFQTMMF